MAQRLVIVDPIFDMDIFIDKQLQKAAVHATSNVTPRPLGQSGQPASMAV